MILNKPVEKKDFLPVSAGKSPHITQINQAIHKLAQSDVNVMLTGEPGTGKKMIAQEIHALSKSAHRPFSVINCNQVSTIENFEITEYSTLYLDEITEMPLSMQIKFLRLLQEKKQSSIRIFASTNKNIEKAITQGLLKEDLYYRLQAFSLNIPPLRERIEDLPYLISSLSEKLNLQVHFSKEALERLKSYWWPGNITELAHLLERLSITHPNREIYIENLQQSTSRNNDFEQVVLANAHHAKPSEPQPELPDLPPEGIDLKKILLNLEANYIRQALYMTNGVVAHAADKLKIRRTTLVEKMKKYQIFSK